MRPKRTAPRPRILRRLLTRSTLAKLAFLLFIWTILEAHIIYDRIALAERRARAQTKPQIVLKNPPRVYIASLHWNSEETLRAGWNKGVLDLVKTLGPENAFVSVYESGSWDDSKGALRELDRKLKRLGVGRKIVLEDETHADLIAGPPTEEGWVVTPSGTKQLRRIPYLSRLRNLSLEPLLELAKNGTTFDHVLFLGDVSFFVSDILKLIYTNDGNYAAACSLDFNKPPLFYDTFALRDAEGHEHASQTWPYFRASKSRRAMTHGEPVPVSSCWNGIVVMPTSAFTGDQGLKFRGIDDELAASHLEGSECCLIHADNPASRTEGVFLNPVVRVGYNWTAYNDVHPRGGGSWVSLSDIWFGLWRNRLARWFTTPWFKEGAVRGKVRLWERGGDGREEKGGFCLVNEMQVVVRNGWAHL